ncbi:hypothetical protein [Cellulomonas sp. HZM]|uniref:hypothetical protein n=1 Tax=Cellulomonas sp. HZM TaxID=1454010 RepID=UPI000493339F|nr:hypothetical protein [Cellulomonas sp. HZM]
MRLRDGLRVLPRSTDEVQVGTDPRWAVRVTDLLPDEVRALVEHGADLPAGSDRLRAVSGELVDAGLAARPARARTAGAGPAAADLTLWGLLEGDPGRAKVAARSSRVVGVLGLGPTGAAVAVMLAAAGVGTVLLDDERPVRSSDVGVGGYRWGDVGSRRDVVVARLIRDTAPRTRTGTTREPDLVVLVEHGAADPVRAPVLLSTGVPHLSVVLTEAGAQVGPLVVAGDGPCLTCLDLHRADLDSAWPAVADALARPQVPGDEPGTLVASAAASSVTLCLDHLDGRLADGAWEIALPDVVPRRRDWAVHPSCGCTAQSWQ